MIVTKKRLARLHLCERQVAWAQLYGIPQAGGDEEEGWRLGAGNSFHDAAAAAQLADDLKRIIADFGGTLHGSERADLLMLWELSPVSETPGVGHPADPPPQRQPDVPPARFG